MRNSQQNYSFDFFISPAILTTKHIIGTAERVSEEVRYVYYYDILNDKCYTKDIVPNTFTHYDINFPLTALGDSIIVSLLDPGMFDYDIKRSELDTNLVNHLDSGGFCLVLHHLK